MVFISVYLGMFSSETKVPMMVGYILSIIGFLFLLALPESPMYLFGKD